MQRRFNFRSMMFHNWSIPWRRTTALRGGRRTRIERRQASPCFELLEQRQMLSSTAWIGASGNWNQASNWNNGIPTATSDVTISPAAAQTITIQPGEADTVNSLNLGSNATLAMPGGGAPTNLLANSDFESPVTTNSTTPPATWTPWGASYLSSQYAYTGSQSLVASGANSGMDQPFTPTPGTSYTASIYAMMPATDPLTGNAAGFLELYFNDSSNNQLSNPSVTILTASSATGGPLAGSVGGQGWNHFSLTAVAPAGAASATVVFELYSTGNASGSVYCDDFDVGPTVPSPSTLVAGSISNSGTLTVGPTNTVTIGGALTQTSTGTLDVQLGGASSMGLFGLVKASGTATLAGTLEADSVYGYAPSTTDSFTPVTFASESGGFASEKLPSISGYTFTAAVNATNITIAVQATVQFTIDPLEDVQPISPFIYGMNNQSAGQAGPANLTLNQLEGNSYTDFNWENNATNAGTDWYCNNDDICGGDTTLSADIGKSDTTISVADAAAIATSNAAIASTPGAFMIWIDNEMMQVTAVDTTANTLTVVRGLGGTTPSIHNSPAEVILPGGGIIQTLQSDYAQDQATLLDIPINGYVAADTGINGFSATSPAYDVLSEANYLVTRFKQELPVKGTPFTLTPNPNGLYVYEDEFVNWLKTNFPYGQTDPTRPIWIALDNEPDLWPSTHPEVRNDGVNSTTLTAAIGPSDTTIHVADAAAIAASNAAIAANPSAYMIWIDSEMVQVTAVDTTANTLTVTRGVTSGNAGTPATAHAIGATVFLPNPTTYAELLQDSIEYAQAIKSVAPNCLVFGSANYGWDGYTSLQNAPDADGREFLDYYLQQMQQASVSAGERLLDVLDVHFYTSTPNDPVDIMQAPRSLWDPTYMENSWIAQSVPGPIELLPRLQAKISQFYPGTKLAIGEYNYGGGTDISGAIAEADALGIFGREGVYSAAEWPLSSNEPYTDAAFEMYRNFDGADGAFGDTSIQASNSDTTDTSIYASVDSTNPNAMTLVAINKTGQAITADMLLDHVQAGSTATFYQLTGASPTPQIVGTVTIGDPNDFTYTMPADSVTTIRIVLASGNNKAPTVTTPAKASVSLVTGVSTNLSVLGADAGGAANLTYTWATTGTPPAPVTFSVNDSNAAQNTVATFSAAGAYTCLVTITDAAGYFATSSVSVTVDATLTHITVTPFDPTTPVNGQQQIAATGTDQFGNALSTPPTYVWSASAGSITSAGLFTAPAAAGSSTIKAVAGGVQGSTTVPVVSQTTIPVATASDTALHNAVVTANTDAANGVSATILFAAGLAGDTITLSQGPLELTGGTGAITISGGGLITISGGGNSEVFRIDNDAQVTLNGLTIEDGNASGASGGGIDNTGTLIINNSTLAGNTAGASGGGIDNTGSLTLTNVILTGNTAGASGGGIENEQAGTLSATNLTCSNNSALSSGGIDNAGTLMILGATISGNKATSSNGAGGGIGSAGTLTLMNATLTGNSAFAGGGIYNAGLMTVTGSTIDDNTGTYIAGGINNVGTMTVTNSTLAGNYSYLGGGIYNGNYYGLSGILTLSNDTLTSNFAAYGAGGGIYMANGSYSSTGSTLTLLNTLVAGNFASGNNSDPLSNPVLPFGPDIQVYSGTVSGAYNLVGDGQGLTGISNGDANHNLVGTATAPINPLLAAPIGNPTQTLVAPPVSFNVSQIPLVNNGGPTQTIALSNGSPAIGSAGVVTTVTAPVTSGAVTIPVADAAAIASTPGQYLILIDGEEMKVTNVNLATNSLTVSRGINGVAVALNPNDPVYLYSDQRGVTRATPSDIGAYALAITPATPVLTVSTTSLTLSATTEGNAGATMSFTVSGSGLGSGDTVSLTTPAGCQISQSATSGFAGTLSLSPNASGSLANTTVYARISSSATASVSGNLTVDDGNHPSLDKTLAVSGTVNPVVTPSLTVSASSLTLPATTAGTAGSTTSFTVSGNGLGSGDTVSLTAPAGCQISQSATSGFAGTLSLSPNASGSLANTTVYARISASATANVSGNLTLADALHNSVNKSITVGGKVNPATVSAVSTTAAAGAHYKAGGSVSITVTLSGAVKVTGTPQLTLNAGSGATAKYTSGSGTSTLTFTYTVAAGQHSSDLDYASTTALTLNGGSIQDLAGNAAVLTLPATGTDGLVTKKIVIDTTRPTVSAVSTTAAAGTHYRAGGSVSITVTLNEAVKVTGTPQLTLNAGSGATAKYTSGSGTSTLTFTYTVAAGQHSSDLDYASTTALTLNGGSIQDLAGNAAVLTLPATGTDGLVTKKIVIDTTRPTVSAVSTTAAAGTHYRAGGSVSITVTLNEAVKVTGTPQLTLNAGSGATAKYTSGSGTSTLTFTYTVAAGQHSSDLDYASTTALTLNGGSIQDLAGNAAVLTLPATGTDGLAKKKIVIRSTARAATPPAALMNLAAPPVASEGTAPTTTDSALMALLADDSLKSIMQ